MNVRDGPGQQKVTCTVCGKRMELHRRVSAPALGKGHEFQYWECGCGNVRVITSEGLDAPDKAKELRVESEIWSTSLRFRSAIAGQQLRRLSRRRSLGCWRCGPSFGPFVRALHGVPGS